MSVKAPKKPAQTLCQPDWSLEEFRGEAALAHALTPDRLRDWENLAEDKHKVTVFQSPGFVLTWYEVYAPAYEPLLLAGRGPEGGWVGVLPLAIPRDAPHRVVFAGASHCEYAGWLASPPLQDEFPARCVAHLREGGLFQEEWHWRWLAPGTGMGWLEHPALRPCGVAGRTAEAANPLWVLQPHPSRQFFASQEKNYKRKMSRLRRLGEVRLVPLDAAGLTEELFTAFKAFNDIRTLARYGVAPFTDDPHKGVFHRRLLERAPEAVHLFALMAGETPVAFSYNLRDKGRAINCMSPFHPRWLAASPGKLVCDHVADALAQRGMDAYDLGPGGDPYKEEIAATHEVVRSLRLFTSRGRALWHTIGGELRAHGKGAATALGISGDRIRQARALLSPLRGRRPGDVAMGAARSLGRWIWSKDVFVVFHMDRSAWRGPSVADTARPPLQRDALEAFLLYSGSDRWRSRQGLMHKAIRRIARGEHCYTVVEGGRLVHYSWLQLNPKMVEIPELGLRFAPRPNTACPYDSYTEPHARGRGFLRRALQRQIDDAFALGTQRIMSWSRASNRSLRRPSEAVGLRVHQAVTRTRILGWSRRWVERVP